MTVDELVKKVRELKKAGKLTGQEKIMTEFYEADTFEIQEADTLKPVMVRKLTEDESVGKWQNIYKIVDGRGKPNGTERAVRIL